MRFKSHVSKIKYTERVVVVVGPLVEYPLVKGPVVEDPVVEGSSILCAVVNGPVVEGSSVIVSPVDVVVMVEAVNVKFTVTFSKAFTPFVEKVLLWTSDSRLGILVVGSITLVISETPKYDFYKS